MGLNLLAAKRAFRFLLVPSLSLLVHGVAKIKIDKFKDKILKDAIDYSLHASSVEQILHPFASRDCYLTLRNYMHLDFVQSKVPVVMKLFVPTIRTLLRQHIVWVPSKLPVGNRFNTSMTHYVEGEECKSKYLTSETSSETGELVSKCVSISSNIWNLAGRPGNCKLTIDYFMPKFVLNNKEKLKVNYPASDNNSKFWEPSIPYINLLVTEHEFSEGYLVEWLIRWVKQSTFPQSIVKGTMMAVYFVIQVNGKILNSIEEQQVLATLNIKTINLRNEHLKNISLASWYTMKQAELRQLEQSLNAGETFWVILGTNLLPKLLLSCADNLLMSTTLQTKGVSTVEERNSKTNFAFAHITQLIMGNFSYPVGLSEICTKSGRYNQNTGGKLRPHSIYLFPSSIQGRLNASVLYSIIFNSTLKNFRFVVCGNRGSSQFVFRQLTAIFQVEVWVCALITLICVCLAMVPLRNSVSPRPYETSTVEIFKVFVEQSNPFPDDITSCNQLRLIVAGVMLSGIVISNAYKNRNIYLMTRPRSPIKYETIAQLQEDNYVLYTRIMHVLYYWHRLNILNSKITKRSWNTGYSYTGNKSRTFETVFSTNSSIYTEYRLESWQHDLQDKSQINLAVPPVNAKQELYRPFEHIKRKQSIPAEHYLREAYIKWQEMTLLHSLQKCNKTAILLPEVVIGRYKKLIQLNTHPVRLDVSKEIFRKLPYGLNFGGLIPSTIRDRIGAIKQGGILIKWGNVFRFDLNKEASLERETVSAAQLSGNILIIFALYISGLLLAALVILVEQGISARTAVTDAAFSG